MKLFFRIFFSSVFLLVLVVIGARIYLKYSVKNSLTEETFQQMVDRINASPPLPLSFKRTYLQVYPDYFKTDFVETLFKKSAERPASAWTASFFLPLCAQGQSASWRHFTYLGLIWNLEDNVSQEKCFEYCVSRMDFLFNVKGAHHASVYYYKKPIDSLSLEEQLALILKIKSPSLYNEFRNPERCKEGVGKLKAKLTGDKND